LEKYKDHIIHFVYHRQDGLWKMVGRIVFDASQLAPVKGEAKLNPLYLGESF
jgi:hypothetical protein